MTDGIYHVRFSSSTQDFGEGIVTVKDGHIYGGDHGYLYLGKASEGAGVGIEGQLRIKRWNPAVASVFGNIQEFELQLQGSQVVDRSFNVSGNVVGQPNSKINISGRFLSDLA